MIAGLKLHPVMKDSGLPWCPEVPEHWELNPNRAYLRQRKVLVGDRHKDYALLSLTKRGVIVRDLTQSKGKFSADMGTSQEVRSGDLVMCLFDVPETPRTVGLSEYDGMITSAYTVFDLQEKQEARWLELFYLTMDDQKALSPLYSGLRNTIQKPRFLGTKTPIPPLAEQAAIVRYVDHVDRRVRRLTRAKRKLIALLTEQKQVIIHRAVTRGLDPDVPLKESGIVAGSLVDPRLSEHRSKILIAPNHIERDASARLLGQETADEQGADSGKYEVRAGEIVYCKIRPYLRKAVIAPLDCLCSADMYPIALRANGKVTADFLLLEMLSQPFTNYTIECSLRAAMPKINREALGDAPVWLPPLAEQGAILKHLAESTLGLEEAMNRAKREIELLNEYRTRLITDVVTGKLDVRDAAAALPEVDPLVEDDEPGDLDDEMGLDIRESDNVFEEMEA